MQSRNRLAWSAIVFGYADDDIAFSDVIYVTCKSTDCMDNGFWIPAGLVLDTGTFTTLSLISCEMLIGSGMLVLLDL